MAGACLLFGIAAAPALVVGCADVWGFRDLRASSDGGADTSTEDVGARDATAEAQDSGGSHSDTGAPDADDGCVLVTHTDSIGQTWTDCAPLGTYDETEATAACEANAHVQSPAPPCVANACGDAGALAICDVDLMVPGYCTCWTYAGTGAGTVLSQACDVDAGPSQAACAGPGNEGWH